eukprot:5605491-Amphidinium_carterae.1
MRLRLGCSSIMKAVAPEAMLPSLSILAQRPTHRFELPANRVQRTHIIGTLDTCPSHTRNTWGSYPISMC